jgi:hypothetical protein
VVMTGSRNIATLRAVSFDPVALPTLGYERWDPTNS